LNPLAQSINGLRLIAFGVELGNELKSIHFIMILQQRKGWWKVLVGSSELRKFSERPAYRQAGELITLN
jgi:hypothetical protein